MKVLTTNQEQILGDLIEYAGGNDTLQKALELSGKPETSLDDLLGLIDQIRGGRKPETPATPPREVVAAR